MLGQATSFLTAGVIDALEPSVEDALSPVREIRRPKVNRRHGSTASFSQKEAREVLDAPDAGNLQGLRDCAILAVGFYAGCRRSEIAGMTVASFHTTAGHAALRFVAKGG